MGLQIGDIVPRKEIEFKELKGKVIAVDALNAIYQFLSSIRQSDGTPLMDSSGRVTSHLSGLFYRNIALLSEGIRLIYVFDGEYHKLKEKTHEIRQEAKEIAREKYKRAVEDEDIESMGKYARGFTKVDSTMVAESKELLEAMGIAVVQAPGEGEMQCAELVKSGQAFAVGSQDYDAIAVGGRRLIQNLTLSRKRRTRTGYVYIAPEIIEYEKVLNSLGIDGDQLISLAILVGTDFNPGGVKGIGPKKALSLVKEKKYPVKIFGELEEQGRLDFSWKDVFEIFKKPNVILEKVEFPKLDKEKIKEILVKRHEFSEERVNNQFDKLREIKEQGKQRTLF
ncbi:flap endonuclease-1 [Candidatus Pacearchaeota archaeon]|nr:flap endonuclease-1 [Candidatus Pacearchaeota archaeon]